MAQVEREYIDENELRRLEQELRKFGTPYVSPEPDEIYWANFRTRVLDRVEAPRKSVAHRVLSWVMGHPVVSGVSTLVSASVVAFMLMTSSLVTPPAHQNASRSTSLVQSTSPEVQQTPDPRASQVASGATNLQPAHEKVESVAHQNLASNEVGHTESKAAIVSQKPVASKASKNIAGTVSPIPKSMSSSVTAAEREQQALVMTAAESAAQVAAQTGLTAPSTDVSLGELSSDELEDVYQALMASE